MNTPTFSDYLLGLGMLLAYAGTLIHIFKNKGSFTTFSSVKKFAYVIGIIASAVFLGWCYYFVVLSV